eukprot:261418-Pelagomonas_calceolata.AAC.2
MEATCVTAAMQVNDDVVVDSTNCGGISRFCNHCCMPSLYTRVINDANNNPHVAFYAKTDLKPGQELTFDYRCDSRGGGHPCPCLLDEMTARGWQMKETGSKKRQGTRFDVIAVPPTARAASISCNQYRLKQETGCVSSKKCYYFHSMLTRGRNKSRRCALGCIAVIEANKAEEYQIL